MQNSSLYKTGLNALDEGLRIDPLLIKFEKLKEQRSNIENLHFL